MSFPSMNKVAPASMKSLKICLDLAFAYPLPGLGALKARSRAACDADPYLRDIVERNLEVAAQRCLDICHRIISIEKALKPGDYREAFLRMSELGVLPPKFARKLAPIAGFRNILVHEYLGLDWNEVYSNLQKIDDLVKFAEYISEGLKARSNPTL
jgi:uncharacterized protein YutE (UPF0331/DUF86 family)